MITTSQLHLKDVLGFTLQQFISFVEMAREERRLEMGRMRTAYHADKDGWRQIMRAMGGE